LYADPDPAAQINADPDPDPNPGIGYVLILHFSNDIRDPDPGRTSRILGISESLEPII
jgi:hypothetical protein